MLNDFYDDVVEIERDLLNNSELTLLSLLISLEPLSVILEAFVEAIQQVRLINLNIFLVSYL